MKIKKFKGKTIAFFSGKPTILEELKVLNQNPNLEIPKYETAKTAESPSGK